MSRPQRLPLGWLCLLILVGGSAHGASKARIAVIGDAAPGGGVFAGPGFSGAPAAAGNGWIAFRGEITGGGSSETMVVARMTPPLARVQDASLGQAAPSGGGHAECAGKLKQFFGNPALNAKGEVAFIALVEPPVDEDAPADAGSVGRRASSCCAPDSWPRSPARASRPRRHPRPHGDRRPLLGRRRRDREPLAVDQRRRRRRLPHRLRDGPGIPGGRGDPARAAGDGLRGGASTRRSTAASSEPRSTGAEQPRPDRLPRARHRSGGFRRAARASSPRTAAPCACSSATALAPMPLEEELFEFRDRSR
jgi:hypothetical protein